LATRSSPRFKSNAKKKKPAMQLAQEMLEKKWGILDADKDLEKITLQQYIDMYRKPLSQSAMSAVKKLTEVAEAKRKKRRLKQTS
jgi:predicted solute-binding protein